MQAVAAQHVIPVVVAAVILALMELLTQMAALVELVDAYVLVVLVLLYLLAQREVGLEALVDQVTFARKLAVAVARAEDILVPVVVVVEMEHPPLRAVVGLAAAVDMAAV